MERANAAGAGHVQEMAADDMMLVDTDDFLVGCLDRGLDSCEECIIAGCAWCLSSATCVDDAVGACGLPVNHVGRADGAQGRCAYVQMEEEEERNTYEVF